MKTDRDARGSGLAPIVGARLRAIQCGCGFQPQNHRLEAGATSRCKWRRAFTLLEVLLAVALFAIAVVVLAGAYVNVIEGMESVRSDRAFEQELRWIREKVLLEPDLKKVEEGDEAPTPDFGNARWEVVVEPTGVADLFLISLHVEMEGNDDEPLREVNEQFMVLRPAWSEPLDRDKLRNEARTRIEEARRFHGVLSKEEP